jgi:hypothetical protein
MDWDDYFRQQATMYRELAQKTEDSFIKQELLELAAVCEEVANNIEDRSNRRLTQELVMPRGGRSAAGES